MPTKITVELSAPTLTEAGKKLQHALQEVREEVAVIRERDPAARSNLEVLLLYSGLHALLAYRVAHRLHENKHYFSARLISQAARHLTGIEIHPAQNWARALHRPRDVGGDWRNGELGDNCTLYQGVTLGGTDKDVGKRHPTLGNNVMVGAGAKVLGPFKVGDNVKIAANAVVLNEIPPTAPLSASPPASSAAAASASPRPKTSIRSTFPTRLPSSCASCSTAWKN